MGTVAPTFPSSSTQLAWDSSSTVRAISSAMRARAQPVRGKSPGTPRRAPSVCCGDDLRPASAGPPGVEVVAMNVPRIDLERARREAKALLAAARAGEPKARARLRELPGELETRHRPARNRTRARRAELARARAPCRARVRDDARACRRVRTRRDQRPHRPRRGAARARPGDRTDAARCRARARRTRHGRPARAARAARLAAAPVRHPLALSRGRADGRARSLGRATAAGGSRPGRRLHA